MCIPYIILSFPRSGNHWCRYIVEYFSDRATIGADCHEKTSNWVDIVDSPMYKRTTMLTVDETKSPIAKKRHKLITEDRGNEKLLTLIRDPFEAITRHITTIPNYRNFSISNRVVSDCIDNYFYVLSTYNKWSHSKNIIYYKDLITTSPNFGLGVRSVAEFFDVFDEHKFNNFVNKINEYKNDSIGSLITKTMTNGDHIKYHCDNLSTEIKQDWLNYMNKHYSDLVYQYLNDIHLANGQLN